MKKMTLCLISIFLYSIIYSKKIASLPELVQPQTITMSKNRVYITEGPTILIYDINNFKLIKKIGRAGEGPKEFRVSPTGEGLRIDVQKNYILVNSFGKVSFFTLDGNLIKEMKPTTDIYPRFKVLDKMFVGYSIEREKNSTFTTIHLFDSKLKKVKKIYRQKHFYQRDKGVDPVGGRYSRFNIYENKMYIDGDDGVIYVYNKKGKNLSSINYKFEKIEITEGHKKRYINLLKTDPRTKPFFEQIKGMIKFKKHFPSIRNFLIDNNKIYVLSYKKKNKKSEFVIFDIQGKFQKKVMVSTIEKNIHELFPYTIKNEKLYQLIENMNEEEWELHVEEIGCK